MNAHFSSPAAILVASNNCSQQTIQSIQEKSLKKSIKIFTAAKVEDMEIISINSSHKI